MHRTWLKITSTTNVLLNYTFQVANMNGNHNPLIIIIIIIIITNAINVTLSQTTARARYKVEANAAG